MRSLLIAAWLALVVAAHAVEPGEQLADPALEARARALSQELRCVVCQNQSIDDSDAALAADLRRSVRERLNAGDTDAQVIEFLVARYGDFVRLKPPFDVRTYALWFAPFLILIAGAVLVTVTLRRQRRAADLEGDEVSIPGDD